MCVCVCVCVCVSARVCACEQWGGGEEEEEIVKQKVRFGGKMLFTSVEHTELKASEN